MNVQSPFYLAVLDSTTVHALKKRISGLIKVSKRRMVLFYCGEILDDEDILREDMFELKTLRTFEDNLFQPKVYLHILPGSGEDDNDEDGSSLHSSQEIESEEERNYEEEAAFEEKMRLEKIAELKRKEELKNMKILTKELVQSSLNKFDLKLELGKINCLQFYENLHMAGYSDEGAFSCLTDEVMAGPELW
eukprot:CAMPEP_0119041268 /NCGR_PEP_ID=MMETSP1177-20130426/11468_1 /TAXON_ID=2985 /ORGANISM="Ochromonas sp, Strain CCMP1899" /LENGTH=191 /DNA_ID=CAMNT_0007007165 /DNA_START=633 /DNA_END=1205 /DNA_ORIENTATION=+